MLKAIAQFCTELLFQSGLKVVKSSENAVRARKEARCQEEGDGQG
jgi:hypothetical protein